MALHKFIDKSSCLAAIKVSFSNSLIPTIERLLIPTANLGKCLNNEISTSLKSTLALILWFAFSFTKAIIFPLNKYGMAIATKIKTRNVKPVIFNIFFNIEYFFAKVIH